MANRQIVVIQARMGSSRLPGKSLASIGGMPMLMLLIHRLNGLGVTAIVVATSDRGIDDPIADAVSRAQGITLIRGSETDVLSRFTKAIDLFDADVVVRLTADNPCVDARSIRAGLRAFDERGHNVAIVTNHHSLRTDPYGLGVEVFATSALHEFDGSQISEHHREHVTTILYEQRPSGAYRIMDGDYSDLRWTVDTESDLARMRECFEACGRDASLETLAEWDTAH